MPLLPLPLCRHSSPCHNGGTLGDSVHQHLCNDAQGPASGGKDVHRTIGERLKNEAEKNSAFPKESKEFFLDHFLK
jgi:hypothetical protein